LQIEALNYEFPWTEGVFKDCFRAMNYVNFICEDPDDVIVGYCILSVAAGEAHVMNISVSPAFQRKGAAQKMMDHMIRYASSRADKLFLEVRPSNIGAVSLYRKVGFREIGVRKGYYPTKDGREDALMFALDLVPML